LGRRKITPLKTARQCNRTSKDVQSASKTCLANKHGSNDLDLENESETAGEYPEQSKLPGLMSVKKRRVIESLKEETKNSGGNL
jgi:hypothetical protein